MIERYSKNKDKNITIKACIYRDRMREMVAGSIEKRYDELTSDQQARTKKIVESSLDDYRDLIFDDIERCFTKNDLKNRRNYVWIGAITSPSKSTVLSHYKIKTPQKFGRSLSEINLCLQGKNYPYEAAHIFPVIDEFIGSVWNDDEECKS